MTMEGIFGLNYIFYLVIPFKKRHIAQRVLFQPSILKARNKTEVFAQ